MSFSRCSIESILTYCCLYLVLHCGRQESAPEGHLYSPEDRLPFPISERPVPAASEKPKTFYGIHPTPDIFCLHCCLQVEDTEQLNLEQMD